MSKPHVERTAKGLTQVLLVFWVGGLWWITLLLAPLLEKVGLAHSLVAELMRNAVPMMAAVALLCIGLQTLLLGFSRLGVARVFRLLLIAALACSVTLVVNRWLPQWVPAMFYSSVVASFAGLLLVFALCAPQK